MIIYIMILIIMNKMTQNQIKIQLYYLLKGFRLSVLLMENLIIWLLINYIRTINLINLYNFIIKMIAIYIYKYNYLNNN